MSPPMLPSVNDSAIHGSKRVMTFGRTSRMGGEIMVEAVGPGIHQPLEPVGAGFVIGLERGGLHVHSGAQVAPDRFLALGLGEAAERGEIVHLDAVEVVFGLRVDHPEHRVGITLAAHMGDAPFVAGDGDALRLGLRRDWFALVVAGRVAQAVSEMATKIAVVRRMGPPGWAAWWHAIGRGRQRCAFGP